MTLQQLEYILAVNQFRHFAKAAEYCRVTQPTLSAMIQKLEEELDTKIFDRSQQPVCPTPIGPSHHRTSPECVGSDPSYQKTL